MSEILLNLKILLSFLDIVRRKDFMLGGAVQEIEANLADFCGAKYAFGVASGTDALILSLKACDIGPGDEVITPAVGFFSSAAAISWVNARPVFVDVDPNTFNIDVSKIEAAITPRAKALLPIHLNGKMADMDPALEIARKHGLRVIADAAQAIGSRYKDKPIGQFGDLVCLSLNHTKIFSGFGDGGMIFTNDKELAEKISMMRTYGAPTLKESHSNNVIIGVASRLSPFHAAVLNVKFQFLESYIAKQRENYFLYQKLLKGVGDLILPDEHSAYFTNGYRFSIRTKRKKELTEFLHKRGLRAMDPYAVPLPYLPAFKNLGYKTGDFPIAEEIAKESLALPVHYSLPQDKIVSVANQIKRFLQS